MAPTFQFTFKPDSPDDTYIVEAVTWLEACVALVGSRQYEVGTYEAGSHIDIDELTMNSVIRDERD